MPKTNKPVVLVADDEPSTRALVAGHLRAKGYKIIEASDGDEAWELAHEHLPHAVVLDVMMPGMSGWEVCRKIREAVSLAHTGVVMLTGIGENLNELTSPLYGADAYVDKPFEFGDLDRKLADTLAKRGTGTVGRPDGADKQQPTTSAAESTAPKKARAAKAKPAKPAAPKPESAPAKPRKAKAAEAKPEPKKTRAAKAKPEPKKTRAAKAKPRKPKAAKTKPKKTKAAKTKPKKTRAAKAKPRKPKAAKTKPKKTKAAKTKPKKATRRKAPARRPARPKKARRAKARRR